jgi:hypothetical protein
MGAQVQSSVKAVQSCSLKPANASLLQRQCACGKHAMSGECVECRKKKGMLQRAAVGPAPNTVPPIVHEALRSPGQTLDRSTQALMEPKFGHDFSRVRVHTDVKAGESARAVNAMAYTVGRDVVFGAGQYAPTAREGQKLIAHELTHVLQQASIASDATPNGLLMGSETDPLEYEADKLSTHLLTAGFAPSLPNHSSLPPITHRDSGSERRLRRATFNLGAQLVQIDYGNVASVLIGDYASAAETLFSRWTGSPATLIHVPLAALNSTQQRWVLFALDLLVDNTTAAHSALNRIQAVQRLIAHAPVASHRPLGPKGPFEIEVLQVSGWSEVALTARLVAPTGARLTAVQTQFNPPPGATAPPGGALDLARLNAELPPALTLLLNTIDPTNWPVTSTQSMGTLKAVADTILEEARSLFAPYIDSALGNPLASNWTYSANLISTTSIVPTHDQRIGYLLNRAEIVGRRDRPGGSIFANTNYDSGRDQGRLLAIVTSMESDPAIQATANRLIQQTGRTQTATRTVGITPDYNAAMFTECQARWRSILTLSHELVHALVHPNFPAQATNVRFGQIIREGFTEVMGVQLYDRLRARALAETAFKARLEAGIATSCPPGAATTIGYGEAGPSAERIRQQVGNDNFRAAYFLGAVKLVGL